MDFNIIEYIKPELLILIPVLYFIGMGLKNMMLPKERTWKHGSGIPKNSTAIFTTGSVRRLPGTLGWTSSRTT